MEKRGSVYIIPDENKILEDEFYQEILKDHIEALIEFSKKYNLNYNFTEEDSVNAPYVIAQDGHLVIKIEESSGLVCCYIPKVVTDRQNSWIHNNSQKLKKYRIVGGFGLEDTNIKKKPKEINGLDDIIRICNKRNMFYERKEVNIYARKKI